MHPRQGKRFGIPDQPLDAEVYDSRRGEHCRPMPVLLLALLLALPTFAQSKGEMVTKYLAEWSGYSFESAVFQRYVDIQADAEWWIYLCTNRTRKSNGLFDLAGIENVLKK